MPDIAEPLRPARILVTPKKYRPLKDFSCGRKGDYSEKLVNECARNLYLGRETLTQTLVVLEDANGKLIGICSFHPHALGRFSGNAQRIHVVGIDRKYRGKRLEDGSRPGDALLHGSLGQIGMAGGDRMPHVSALVNPENHHSRALFARHGFRELPYPGEGAIKYVRSAPKQLPILTPRPAVALRRMIQKVRDGSPAGEAVSALEPLD